MAAAAVLAGASALADPGPARKDQIIHRLLHDCGSCHGMTLRGGLGPPLVPSAISDKPEDYLVSAILSGLPGTPMPPWDFELSPEEAAWLVQTLKDGLSHDD